MKKNSLIANSINNNSFYDLMIGSIDRVKSVNANLPTDSDHIFQAWVEYQSTTNNTWNVFLENLIKLSKDKELGWFSIYYLYRILHFYRRNPIDNLNPQELIDKIVNNLENNKSFFTSNYNWTGDKEYSFSLWEDIKRLTSKLELDLNYKFKLS